MVDSQKETDNQKIGRQTEKGRQKKWQTKRGSQIVAHKKRQTAKKTEADKNWQPKRGNSLREADSQKEANKNR